MGRRMTSCRTAARPLRGKGHIRRTPQETRPPSRAGGFAAALPTKAWEIRVSGLSGGLSFDLD